VLLPGSILAVRMERRTRQGFLWSWICSGTPQSTAGSSVAMVAMELMWGEEKWRGESEGREWAGWGFSLLFFSVLLFYTKPPAL